MDQSLFRKRAQAIRRASNTSYIEKVLDKAVKALAFRGIPHFVCGGFAVQEHGYPRMTQDVDLIVPDVSQAKAYLEISGFRGNRGSSMTVTDRRTGVEVDLLPGGGKVGPGPVTFPIPTKVSETPVVLTLQMLVSLKLSSYLGSGISRLKDAADVVELIKANQLPREYPVEKEVRKKYQEIWDQLAAELLLGEQ
jgi:hypothetical protein